MIRLLDGLRRHWLFAVNAIVAIFVGLPILAPILMAAGRPDLADPIYAWYHLVCHQWAFRSFFLFGPESVYGPEVLADFVGVDRMFGIVGTPELGYKVAFCERDLAIYTSVLLAGIGYAGMRRRLNGLSLTAYAIMILPMAIDGFTQLFGWRESTVELRLVTGFLFGLGSAWLIYPRLDELLLPTLAHPTSVLTPARSQV